MKLAITSRSIKAHLKSALFVGLGFSVIGLMFAGLFDSMKHQIEEFSSITPDGVEAIVGDLMTAGTPEGWLSVELFAIFVPLGLSILGIIYGSSLIGREEDSGTLELILASPTTRTRVAIEKFLALAKLLAVPPLMLFGAIYIGSLVFPFKPDMWHILGACASGWILGLAFGAITFAVQAVTGKRGVASGVGAGLFTATWLLSIISRILDDWKDYEVYSVFYYYNNPGILVDGMDWTRIFVLVVIAIVGFAVAIIGFNRRDIGV